MAEWRRQQCARVLAAGTLAMARSVGSVLVVAHAGLELTSRRARQRIGRLSFMDDPGVLPIHRCRPGFGRYRVAPPDRPAAVYDGFARER